jgi:hypothetical protein
MIDIYPGNLTAALASAKPNDVLQLRTGSYTEIPPDIHTPSITIEAAPGQQPVLFKLTIRANNTVLRHLEFTGNTGWKQPSITVKAADVRIEDCYIHHAFHGVWIAKETGDRTIIRNCFFSDCEGSGVLIGTNDDGDYAKNDNVIEGCAFWRNVCGISLLRNAVKTRIIGNRFFEHRGRTRNGLERMQAILLNDDPIGGSTGTVLANNWIWSDGPGLPKPDMDGTNRLGENALFPGYTGQTRAGVGDVNGDGRFELIAGVGPGAGPHVKAFDGDVEIRSFMAFDPGFRGGVWVGGVGHNIAVGAGPGAGPHVKMFGPSGDEVASFYAYDPGFDGGVRVYSKPGRIVTVADEHGNEHTKEFDAVTLELLASYFA